MKDTFFKAIIAEPARQEIKFVNVYPKSTNTKSKTREFIWASCPKQSKTTSKKAFIQEIYKSISAGIVKLFIVN